MVSSQLVLPAHFKDALLVLSLYIGVVQVKEEQLGTATQQAAAVVPNFDVSSTWSEVQLTLLLHSVPVIVQHLLLVHVSCPTPEHFKSAGVGLAA